MARRERRLSRRELGHVLGRAAMALCIGWGYLGVVLALDVGGWASWLRESPLGPMVRAWVAVLLGVAFGTVGAHVGLCNVRAETVRAASAVRAERRAAMRRWQRR